MKLHPNWHAGESPWKSRQVLRMLERHGLRPRLVCEVGCGVGEILRQLQKNLDPESSFLGCDISPQAIMQAKPRENERLRFELGDVCRLPDNGFDLALAIDVLEHIEDRYGFLRTFRGKARYKIILSSLMISVQTVLRRNGLLHVRELYGMVNFFTKETLLRALQDTGHEILDWFYTPSCPDVGQDLTGRLLRLPRKLLFAVNEDLAARILGGYRLLVLTR
jgi:2-polyprenyl-3-methyl-5-hydroxy-6-metoxy-1,4-benzoquinol methylase